MNEGCECGIIPINGLDDDMADGVARAGIDPTLAPEPLRAALTAVIAERGGVVTWEADGLNWRAHLTRPTEQEFRARSPEQALGWCLQYLNAPEYGVDDDFL